MTGVTRRLLEHWHDPGQREGKRFFFCQLEAIETLIWLVEAGAAATDGVEVPSDGGEFSRWCTKLATGTGKTVVMSMLIAWQVLNKVSYRQDPRFAKDVFVVAPGLTVKDRLKVLVANWHHLAIENEAQLAKVRSVDQRRRMPRSDQKYLHDVLGELANTKNLLVINDEAHHAWRVNPEANAKRVSKDDLEEATKWVGGPRSNSRHLRHPAML